MCDLDIMPACLQPCMGVIHHFTAADDDVLLLLLLHLTTATAAQIRINPGNFADGRKTFEEINYDDPAQFEAERAHIEEVFTPLVRRQHSTAQHRQHVGRITCACLPHAAP